MTLPSQTLSFQNNFSLSSREDVTDKMTEGFSHWLSAKSYSSSTIRNYLSDINRYFQFIENCKLKIENLNPFSPDSISAYLETIKSDSNYSRYLSSLSKFFQYALDQNLVKTDPLKQAQKVKKPSIDIIVANYQSFLTKKHFSTSTIRNYLNDLRQYIDFCNSQKSQNSNLQNPINQ